MPYYKGNIECDITTDVDDGSKIVCGSEAFAKITISDMPTSNPNDKIYPPRYYYICSFHAEREFPLNHRTRTTENDDFYV